ncbi:MAG: tRNA (adenosine(37)-N6)-dimethylallyltransferase MiaA [Burkholderiaceae bacterium]
MTSPGPPPIVLLGPTASGKSALAMALARCFELEIVSVDSAQVYRGLDIGTAKPDAADRARVAHHLLDLREPDQPYSAAAFVADASAAIAAIRARGHLPLLVGGTMLYARALLAPLDDLPSADPAIRARLDGEAARLGWPALHRRLAALDPVAAARIGSNDPQRIQRALEVIELTGKPLSHLQGSTARSSSNLAKDARPGWTVLAIEPSDRAALHARIATRFDAMLRTGLIDEVRGLLARPGIHSALPALRAVGYRQVAEWLATPQASDASADLRSLRDRGIAATRQLAKRQLTWLRSLPVTERFDCWSPTIVRDVAAAIDRRLGD